MGHRGCSYERVVDSALSSTRVCQLRVIMMETESAHALDDELVEWLVELIALPSIPYRPLHRGRVLFKRMGSLLLAAPEQVALMPVLALLAAGMIPASLWSSPCWMSCIYRGIISRAPTRRGRRL